jgi:hypothetical protein
VFVLPPRTSVTLTFWPGLASATALVRSSSERISLSSILTMMSPPIWIALPSSVAGMSPALIPALSAGPPGVTLCTSAPCLTGRLRSFSELSTVSVWMPR